MKRVALIGLISLTFLGCTFVDSPTPAPSPRPVRVSIEAEYFRFYQELSGLEPEGIFVSVFFEVRNITDSQLSLSNTDFHLIDEEGVQYQHFKAFRRNLGILQPGGLGRQQRLYFDIPKTGFSRLLKLQFRDDAPISLELRP